MEQNKTKKKNKSNFNLLIKKSEKKFLFVCTKRDRTHGYNNKIQTSGSNSFK